MELLIFLLVCALVIVLISMLFGNLELPFFGLYRGTTPGACGYVSKRQWVRLMDVFLLGPIGLFVGYKIYTNQTEDLTPLLGLFIIVYGALTIAYNGSNYLQNIK